MINHKIINTVFYIAGIILIFYLIKLFYYYLPKENYGKIILIFFFLTNLIIGSFFKNFRKKTLVIAFYFFIIIYTTNALITYFTYSSLPINKVRSVLKKNKMNYDDRNWVEYVTDERKLGKKIYPYVTPQEFLDKNKTSLTILTPMINTNYAVCNEYGKWKEIKTDQYGFNNQNIKKNYQILLVGDSYAEGVCVETQFEPANIISKQYKKDTYTIGVSGNGPLLSLALLHEIKKHIITNEVIWLIYSNDFYDLKKESENKYLLNYLNLNFSSNNYYKDIDLISSNQKKFIDENLKKFRKYSLLQDVLELKPLIHRMNNVVYMIFNKKIDNRNSEIIFEKIFIKLQKLYSTNKIKLVYIPINTCFSKNNKSCLDHINILKKTSNNLKVYDFYKYINSNFKDYKPLYALGIDRAHLSALGYSELIKFIMKN